MNKFDIGVHDKKIVEVEMTMVPIPNSGGDYRIEVEGPIQRLIGEMIQKDFEVTVNVYNGMRVPLNGFDLESKTGSETAAVVTGLYLEFKRLKDKKMARFLFRFIKDHAGRFVRINTFEQANAIDKESTTEIAERAQKRKRSTSIPKSIPSRRSSKSRIART